MKRLMAMIGLVILFGCKSAPTQIQETPTSPEPNKAAFSISWPDKDPAALPAIVIYEKQWVDFDSDLFTVSAGFDSSDKLLKAMIAGQIDAAYTDPFAAMKAKKDGAPLTVLPFCSTGGSAIVVHEDEIKHPYELAGRIFAVREKSGVDGYLLNRFAEKYKLDGQIYIVEMPYSKMYRNLFERYIDGFVAPLSVASKAVENENTGFIAKSADIEKGHAALCLTLGPKTAANDAAVKALSDAHTLAVQWIAQNPAKAAEAGGFAKSASFDGYSFPAESAVPLQSISEYMAD